MDIDFEKFERSLLPDSSGQSLKGLFAVVEFWNKNRRDDVLGKIRRTNEKYDMRRNFSLVIFLVLVFSWIAFGAAAGRFGALNSESPEAFHVFILLLVWILSASVTGMWTFMDVNWEKEIPDDLQDFQRLLTILSGQIASTVKDDEPNPWCDFEALKKVAEGYARRELWQLAYVWKNIQEMGSYESRDIQDYNALQERVYFDLKLLDWADLISEDKNQYFPKDPVVQLAQNPLEGLEPVKGADDKMHFVGPGPAPAVKPVSNFAGPM